MPGILQTLLAPFATPPASASDRERIAREVGNGLPCEKTRIAEALENQAFYDLDGERYAPRKEAESSFDYDARAKDESGFTQEVVDVLCEHQYDPGPSRSVVDGGAADELLQLVYEQCHIDALMQRAEVLSTLNDVAAVEVRATNDPDRPIDLHLWGSEEFAVFLSPDDPRKPIAVVTIDRVNQQTRYRLWFPDVVRTFVTQPYNPSRTSGAVLAAEQPSEPNTYGCLPFAFVHYRMPVHRFWTPGVGSFVRSIELRVNQLMSAGSSSLWRFLEPICLFKNVGPEFNPEIGPGRFLRLYKSGTGYTGDGAPETGEPAAEFLQAQLAIESLWRQIEGLLQRGLEAARVPISAVRMEQQGFASGVALMAEQAPLLKRARGRRKALAVYETDLARVVCRVFGAHYDRPELLEAAKTLRLLLSWAEPEIPLPGKERDDNDDWEMNAGITALAEVVMRRKGYSTIEQAIDHLKRVQALNAQVAAFMPKPEPEPAAGDEGQDTEQADDNDTETADDVDDAAD